MDRRSQGSLEYILLLAGVLLIVVLAIIIVRGGVFPQAEHIINSNYNTYNNLINVSNCTPSGC